ncbi:MAG: choice-of-anchor J domain-containing protein [Bacteroidales bacterium]|nr:choice-of-anchor J domain-containing protein [Bacteroidales bacterium]
MKKSLNLFLLLFIALTINAQQTITFPFSGTKSGLEIKASTPDKMRIEASISELKASSSQILNSEMFTNLESSGLIRNDVTGKPELPVFSRLIEVPYQAGIEVNIISYSEEVINLNEFELPVIAPNQPSYTKSSDPSTHVFVIDQEFYNTNEFSDGPGIKTEIEGIMRGTRIGRIEICPFSYNPVENILIVYHNIEFEVRFINADHSLTDAMKSKYYSPEFEPSYDLLLNYKAPTAKDGFSNFTKPIKYVIVANRAFETTLQPFVEWKTISGYNVIEAYTDIIGTTNTAIKAYLEGLYDAGSTSDPAPLYVLIIGDHSGTYSIPAFASTNTGSGGSSHITDVYFGCYDGTSDNIPDLYLGRISANSTTELANALNKIVPYEKYEYTDGAHLDKAMLIAGCDVSYAHSHGDATILYGINNYFNTSHDLSNIYAYYYNHSTGPYFVMSSNSTGAAADIKSKITQGLGFANYTAHCDHDGWADPNVSRADIANFNNLNKYPFMIGNCCLSFQFDQSDAFGEMLLYAANEGAIGYIGTSNSSYWYEDVYWGIGLTTLTVNATNFASHTYANTGIGMYDALYHENGEAFSNWYFTGSQMNFKGNTAVQSSTSGYKKYYWEIYHCVGDPSIMPYMHTPTALSLTFTTPDAGATSLTVNTEAYTYVAISQNGVLLDAKWSGSGTSVNLAFTALGSSSVTIVGTKQNRAPYINENITPGTGIPAAPVANFTASSTNITVGGSVNFTDISANVPTSWAWTFTGGTPSSSTLQNPTNIVYNAAGTYTVQLIATNAQGSDTETKTGYITVIEGPDGFSLDFEACTDYSSNFAPWTVIANNAAATYQSSDCDFTGEGTTFGYMAFNPSDAGFSLASAHGGVRCGMAICPADATQADNWLISEQLTLGTASSLKFWVLSPKPGSWGNETFNVLVSTTNSSMGSFTAIASNQEAPATWTQKTYDLSAYNGQDIYVAIQHVSTDMFMFFIDDIEVITTSGVAMPTANFSANVTSVCAGNSVSFTNLSSGATSYSWTFTGGTPSTSTSTNPTVSYSTPGTYNVSLVATNSAGSITETKTSYITVRSNPTATVTPTNETSSGACNGSANVSVSGGTPAYSYTWSNGQTSNPATNLCSGNYTVTVTDSYGCTGTSNVTITYSTDVDENNIPMYKIFPNPTGGMVYVATENVNLNEIRVVDITGRVVKQIEVKDSLTEIDMQNCEKGLYFFELISERFYKTVRVILD